jgi:pre-mRNA-splicing helicase BRR2
VPVNMSELFILVGSLRPFPNTCRNVCAFRRYRANSNLVLTAERDKRGSGDPTGEVESLTGKLQYRMGDKAGGGSRAPELEEKMKKAKAKREREAKETHAGEKEKAKKQKVFVAGRGSNVLTETEELDAINYRPKTQESKVAYESILSVVQGSIGDQPQDILRGAADEVLSMLKDDRMRDPERHREVEKLIGKVSPEDFNRLVNMGKAITDFVEGDDGADSGAGTNSADAEDDEKMDEEMGVAVVFDDDSEEDEDNDLDEVRDEEEEDDDTMGGVEAMASSKLAKGADSDDDGDDDGEDASALNVNDIDAHWLQRNLSHYYDDANVSAQKSEEVLAILSNRDERACENNLLNLLDFERFDFIKVLLRNRAKVLYCTRLKQAQNDAERLAIEEEMSEDVESDGPSILQAINQTSTAQSWTKDRMQDFRNKSMREAQQLKSLHQDAAGLGEAAGDMPTRGLAAAATSGAAGGGLRDLDLEGLAFKEEGHVMSNKRCELPDKSWRAQKKGYEEVHVPAAVHKPAPGEVLVPIKGQGGMPEWTHPAFAGMTSLNRVQSKMKKVALETNENVLLCAPTGAGKTNVAVMCMLNVFAQHRKPDGSGFDLDAFKIVYVAPMKALVQECVLNFQQRLGAFGIQVKELSGDQSLTRQQISETHIIVTTPEKWDIVTRKSGERTYTQLVRLLIIDEIHLLHDGRGPVLEALVARTIRQVETTHEMVRIVGLSATLPNYADVAAFLRVDPERGLFFFDNSFRPVPLQQQYIGITEKKAIKRFQLMNEICYEKVMACAGRSQVLIFCHSRAETAKTAMALRDLAIENDTVGSFIVPESATAEILKEEGEHASNADLKELLEYGFGIHHAGMTRADRNTVEELFENKHVQVLCSTATLAWGVNLPAHTVIIKGTQMYMPEKGKWVELSPLDIMQMLGRAGRPGYDTEGEGIIITQHSELQYYLSLMNQQLPVESQLVSKLPDMLNAEVVLGGVGTIQDAAEWLSYSYLHVRMLQNPETYNLSAAEVADDPEIMQRRLDLCHTAALALDKAKLCKYDRKSGVLQATTLGRVASHYYVGYESIATYNEYLKPTMSDIELFRLFSLSKEFKFIHVREEEKLELAKLAARVPIPVKEGLSEPSAKVNVLLQAYISNLKLEGFALVADLTFIRQSAARLMRCLLDIALKRGWASLVEKALHLCKMVERKMWRSQSPLRQFSKLPDRIALLLERKDIPWERYYDLKPADLGELVKLPKMGKPLHAFVRKFPRLELSAHVQPITRSLLKVELTITPDFEFDPKVHDYAQLFHIIVEDVDGEQILHHEPFLLKERYATEEHVISFSVPMQDPLPPQYFLRVVSDRWLHAEAMLPISFRKLIMPQKFPPPSELLDLQPLPVAHLKSSRFEKALYSHLVAGAGSKGYFNPIQTQTFTQLYETDDNVLVCAPHGSGKTVCAEFAIMRMLRSAAAGARPRCVYVTALPAAANTRHVDWSRRFGVLGVEVVMLTGETGMDLKLLEKGQIVVATAEQWDMLSRRWRQRKNVQTVSLFVVDDIHLMGGGGQGPTLEVVVSRMRYVASQLESAGAQQVGRIVALGAPIANAKDVGDWLGATGHALFAFHPQVRPVPLDMTVTGFEVAHFGSRMIAMTKPAFTALSSVARGVPAIVFVPSRKQTQLTAIDIMTYAAASGEPHRFLGEGIDPSALTAVIEADIRDPALQQTLPMGVGFVHGGMKRSERSRVEALYTDGVIQVLIMPASLAWEVTAEASLVIIMDTVSYDGREHRYVDYPIGDLLQMVGKAGRPLEGDAVGKCVLLCFGPKKEYLKRLLYEPLPIESQLDHVLHDHLNAEIVTKTVENKQDAVDYLTWSFFWPRLAHNPNYYNLQGVTHRHLSDHLSELVEGVINDLEESRALSVENEMDLSPLNLGMIAGYYYIAYTTVELFASSLTEKTKLRGVLEILTASSEYAELPVRQYEEKAVRSMAHHLPQRLPDSAKYNDPHTKALVLLQAHFSRHPLSSDLMADQAIVLGSALKLLQALVDVISSNGWLKPAIVAMEASQMIVQGLWDRDHPLMQIPHFTKDMLQRCKAEDNAALNGEDVDTIFDIMELEDEVRDDILRLAPTEMNDVAAFCNTYPNIALEYNIVDESEVETGDAVQMVVNLDREMDEDDEEDDGPAVVGQVYAPRFPSKKTEGWWLVVGDKKRNTLLCVKRVVVLEKAKIKLDFVAPEEAGDYALTLYFMCDSYIGCDQEYNFSLSVAQGDSDDDDDDDDDDDE